MKEVRTLHVDAGEDGVRLDRWFKRRWPHLNHIQIQKLARSGQIRVDGARAKPDTRLSAGSQIRVPPLPDAPLRGSAKSSWIPATPPSPGAWSSMRMRKFWCSTNPQASPCRAAPRPSTISIACSAPGGGAGPAQAGAQAGPGHVRGPGAGQDPRSRRQAGRRLCPSQGAEDLLGPGHGPSPAPGRHSFNALIKKGVGDREMVVPAQPKEPGAEAAETEFTMISRAGARVAWMALRPHTGRTHQLRVHMLAMGHPILGDPKYKNAESVELSGPLKLQLHARRLSLPHPSRGTLVLEAPISPEMKAGFAKFGFDQHEADPDPFAKRPAKSGR